MSWGGGGVGGCRQNKSLSRGGFIYCSAGLRLECMVNNGVDH